MQTADFRENSRQIYRYQQLDRARRDIETAVNTALFMGGLNILLLLILTFNPVYAAKTNWFGILTIAIGIPIIFGCTFGIRHHSSIAVKAITAYFIISTILAIYLCCQGLMPSTLIMLTFIPFAPYLFYGLHRGIYGTSMLERVNLNESVEKSIDLYLDNSVGNFAETKFRQQLDLAYKNIETGIKSGLLMGAITFCINVTLFYLLGFISQMMLIFILPLDILVIFGSTLEMIYQKKSSSARLIMLYSIASLIVKTEGIGGGGLPFLFTIVLSTYLFYGLYKGIVGISDLKSLTGQQADFHLLVGSPNHQSDPNKYHDSKAEYSLTVATTEYTEIMLEVERRDRVRQAHNDIKIAMFAALIIGVAQLPIFTTIAFNPVYIAKIGLFQFIVIIVNILSIFGCAYGLYRQSQLAARIMMVCFVVNLIIDICSQNFNNIFNIALRCYLFYGAYKGIVGTSTLKQYR